MMFSVTDERILFLCSQGWTAHEIATEINLSKRTVEHRIERMKLKTSSKTLSELVSLFTLLHPKDGDEEPARSTE